MAVTRNKPPRNRILLFLVFTVAIAAGMQVLDAFIFTDGNTEVQANANVSRGDIRRGIAISLDQGLELISSDASFLKRYATQDVNLLVINIPLHIRTGSPAYLEYNKLLISNVEDLVSRIHEAGIEAALNPLFTGDKSLLRSPKSAATVYEMLNEWYNGAGSSRADAIFLNPSSISSMVPASYTTATITGLQKSFGGSIYSHAMSAKDPIVTLYRSQIKGFILPFHAITSIEDLQLVAGSGKKATEFLFATTLSTARTTILDPYTTINHSTVQTNIRDLTSSTQAIESSAWFRGVIVTEEESSTNTDDIAVWYRHLKKRSIERAFVQQAGALQQ